MPTRPLDWIGTTLRDLRTLPPNVQQRIGYQLYRVQTGLDPDDWKPMKSVGRAVREIRVVFRRRTFRVLYVSGAIGMVRVLHVFEKRSRKTRKKDIELAQSRLKQLPRPE